MYGFRPPGEINIIPKIMIGTTYIGDSRATLIDGSKVDCVDLNLILQNPSCY